MTRFEGQLDQELDEVQHVRREFQSELGEPRCATLDQPWLKLSGQWKLNLYAPELCDL